MTSQPVQPKIMAVGFSAAVTVIIFWLLGYFVPDLMKTAPAGLEAAITAVIATVVGWVKK